MSARRRVKFKFRLYVADNTQNSEAARSNLSALCKRYLQENYEIEIIDVLRESKRALDDGIFMTPTLVKVWPLPVLRVIGTLSKTQLVLRALGLEAAVA